MTFKQRMIYSIAGTIIKKLFHYPEYLPSNQNGDTCACVLCFRTIGHFNGRILRLPKNCQACKYPLNRYDDVIIPRGRMVQFYSEC